MNQKSKDIGPSRWPLITGVIAALLIASLAVWADDAEGAPPGFVTPVRIDTDAQQSTCDEECQKSFGKKRAKNFKAGKLGNAKELRFSKKMQQRIFNKAEQLHGAEALDGCCDWITKPLKATACLVTNPVGTNRGVCDEGQRSWNRIMSRTSKVLLACGGSAVVGFHQGGGGVWGAGGGAGLCLWLLFLDEWYE